MKITLEKIESIPFEVFLNKHGFDIKVKEHEKHWCAELVPFAEIKRGTILSSACEFGIDWYFAVEKLLNKIQGEVLVVDAYRPSRREIKVPRFSDISYDTIKKYV